MRDVFQKILWPKAPDRTLSLIGRLLTIVLGFAGLGVALSEPRMIFWFVLFAWSGLASAFTPVVLLSLFWRRTTLAGAVSGMIAGFLTAMVWVIAVKDHFYDLYEMIPGFAAGFAVTIGVSLFTKPPAEGSSMVDNVKRVVGGPFSPGEGDRSTR